MNEIIGEEGPPSYGDTDSPREAKGTHIRPQHRRLHDVNVTFEEYHYYALKTRELEKLPSPADTQKQSLKDVFLHRTTEKHLNAPEVNFADPSKRISISDDEWVDASRALRTATWGACFYLITTDILGPYGVGFAMGTLGWGPGIALYTVFGFMAGYSGYLLWHCFLGLDSYEFVSFTTNSNASLLGCENYLLGVSDTVPLFFRTASVYSEIAMITSFMAILSTTLPNTC